jgi:hypothetical protein
MNQSNQIKSNLAPLRSPLRRPAILPSLIGVIIGKDIKDIIVSWLIKTVIINAFRARFGSLGV